MCRPSEPLRTGQYQHVHPTVILEAYEWYKLSRVLSKVVCEFRAVADKVGNVDIAEVLFQ